MEKGTLLTLASIAVVSVVAARALSEPDNVTEEEGTRHRLVLLRTCKLPRTAGGFSPPLLSGSYQGGGGTDLTIAPASLGPNSLQTPYNLRAGNTRALVILVFKQLFLVIFCLLSLL